MGDRLPVARKEKLVVREVAGEVLIYDMLRNKAFCLNETAAAVWKLSDGQTTPAQMAARLTKQFNARVEETLVWVALDQLSRDRLLESRITMPSGMSGLTRRAHLRSLGKIAAVAVPAVA